MKIWVFLSYVSNRMGSIPYLSVFLIIFDNSFSKKLNFCLKDNYFIRFSDWESIIPFLVNFFVNSYL